MVGSSAPASLVRPSQMFHEWPSVSTSQRRTNRSALGRLEENQMSALTSPMTSVSAVSGAVV
jgi:hypothetical protein